MPSAVAVAGLLCTNKNRKYSVGIMTWARIENSPAHGLQR
jgi:hypothetical protein